MPDREPRAARAAAAATTPVAERRKQLELQNSKLGIIRKKATNWGKGVGAMLGAVLGFSLIKGPSDISRLETFWSIAAGALIAVALVAGIIAALKLLRAAYGSTRGVPSLDGSGLANLKEVKDSEDALIHGLVIGALSLAFIVSAVGITWYAPEKEPPKLKLTMRSGTVVCGKAESVINNKVNLKSANGPATFDLTDIAGLQPVDRCPNP